LRQPLRLNVAARLLNPSDVILNDNVTFQATSDFDQVSPQYFKITVNMMFQKMVLENMSVVGW
jgi:hypothetical protein